MYCKECGKQIDSDSKYCRYCGKNQNDSGAKNFVPKENKESDSVHETTQKNNISSIKIPTYDNSYKKETIAAFVGGTIIFVNLLYLFIVPNFDLTDRQIYSTFTVINFVWRLVASNWCIKIALRQNRSIPFWGIIGFILPNLSLIILGLSNKFSNTDLINIEWNNNKYKIIKLKNLFSFGYGRYEKFYYKDEIGDTYILYRKKLKNKFFIIDPEPIIFNSLNDYFSYIEEKNRINSY